MRAVISVVGKDKIGILAKVSRQCELAHLNIVDVSQTVLSDMFTMMMIVDTTKIEGSFVDFVEKMEQYGKEVGLSIHVMHEDIFDSMHTI